MNEPEPALIPDDPAHALAMLRGLIALGPEDWADLVRADAWLVSRIYDRAHAALEEELEEEA